MNLLENKFKKLKKILCQMDSLVVAFSGGTDSTLLLKTAHDLLGEKVLAVTDASEIHPSRELEMASRFAKRCGINHIIIKSGVMGNDEFLKNSPRRCYHCKKMIFKELKRIAAERGIEFVADGSNYDDLNDYRPGRLALEELKIRSPMEEAGLKKEEIRELSRMMNLPTWNKPQIACLATRIPYGSEITSEKLKRVEMAEKFLIDNRLSQVRVRDHETVARIEIGGGEIERFSDEHFSKMVVSKFKELGYTYVTLDLEGYRSGSMNEVIKTNG